MRKLLLLVAALLVVHVALLFIHPAGAAAPPAANAIDVGVVFDVGGRGDKSFNDGAYLGAERAEKRARRRACGSSSPARAPIAKPACGCSPPKGMDLVIGVGFIFTDDLTQLAKEYPEREVRRRRLRASRPTRPGNVIPPPPNLAALKFREEEGSFLVGALAALVGKSKKVGFVGGMDIPLIHKFEAGYRAGVKQVCPDCTVHRAVRRRHARSVPQSGQGQGARAQPVPVRA